MAQLKDTTVDGVLVVNGKSVNDALDFQNLTSKCTIIDTSATVNCKASSDVLIISYVGGSVEHYTDQILMNIPDGFRPDSNRYFTGMIGTVPAVFRMYPNGDISIWTASSYPTGRIYFSCTIAI